VYICSYSMSSQTLTRLIYTLNPNSPRVNGPSWNTFCLANMYTNIPYKQYRIYLENKTSNSSLLATINQAIRRSWCKTNDGLFFINDLFVPSIQTIPSEYVHLLDISCSDLWIDHYELNDRLAYSSMI
jgi:hypothetical protein